MSLPKTMENNRKMWTFEEPNKIYIFGKVLMGAIRNLILLNLRYCVKSYGHLCQFSKTTHQIWSCHVTLASNSKNFYFSPNSVLNFRKSYQIWGNLAQEQKVTGKNKLGGGKHPPPPQCL